ncbi:SRPBCC domain-containing protein [Paenibacillus sp. LHD-117]|uniref:SRPBCC family protein n=1 Tax=Paenibacillus sp. LHD-117 TaxID=3071412 RepID=UPI0027E1B007|nr:SRPBCC domain-containing protein [Paenibacillus sp. LHD-117]MDQ6423615.1 SRPBCC domain-containing protein [Paenibacillus sp. LHD-117]
MATTEAKLEIIRTINAPRELVFKVWTEEEHLKHWWGPTGMAIHVAKLDLRPGGIFHYSMTSPDGHKMWGKFIFQEIVAPEKIVFINCFSDEEGNTIPAPFGPEFANFPKEVLNVVTLTEENGRTTLTLRGGPHHATAEEHEFYRSMFESMQQGFDGTFDQLEKYVAQIK